MTCAAIPARRWRNSAWCSRAARSTRTSPWRRTSAITRRCTACRRARQGPAPPRSLAQVGLTDKLRARVATLSGGQTRRAEIARALMHRPRLLLLDEATAGLDVRARREVAHLVRGLVASEGVGVLWATHLFDEIEPADQVVVLHQGRVLATGTAAGIAGRRAASPTPSSRMTGVPREAVA